MTEIASYIDHTLLKPFTRYAEIEHLCDEAREYHFAAVCIPPNLVSLAGSRLADSEVKVATVIGFPFGYSCTKAKLAEIDLAIKDGADELDIVVNLVDLRNGEWEKLSNEMTQCVNLVHDAKKILKVIIESGMLTVAEITGCCELYGSLGVDFLKTSTGYAEKGASVEAVQLMRKNLPEKVKIKASGGIRDLSFAKQLIHAGAGRLGCSAGVKIVLEERNS